MKKLIHVITDANIGGAGVWVLNFLKAYDKEKYDVSVALPTNSLLAPKIKGLGVRVFEISDIADKSFSVAGIKNFRNLFKKEKPDIVHCHASLSARIASKSLGIKTINTRHCLEPEKHGIKKRIYSLVNNCLSDIVIGVSEITCENLLADGTKKNKVKLVYNGVAPLKKLSEDEKKEVRKEFGIVENDIVVGIVARLEPVKNHDLFLEAGKKLADKYENVKLLIVGVGSLENEIREKAKKLGILEKTVFCGYQEDVSRVVNIIDISTLTSHSETLSLSLIEAMTLEKPCVSTPSGGTKEVVVNEVTGYITSFDCDDFVNKVSYYIDNYDERIKAGEEGKKRSAEFFSTKQMMDSLYEIYESTERE